jgi:hypothetical protein
MIKTKPIYNKENNKDSDFLFKQKVFNNKKVKKGNPDNARKIP